MSSWRAKRERTFARLDMGNAAIAVASRRRGLTSGARPVSQSVSHESVISRSLETARLTPHLTGRAASTGSQSSSQSVSGKTNYRRRGMECESCENVRNCLGILGARSTVVSRVIFTDQRRPREPAREPVLPRDAQSYAPVGYPSATKFTFSRDVSRDPFVSHPGIQCTVVTEWRTLGRTMTSSKEGSQSLIRSL